jgi:hypothetical protein
MKIIFTIGCMLLLSSGTLFAQSNSATITQDGNNHEASIEQAGLSNSAAIDQSEHEGHTALIQQTGDLNEASIELATFTSPSVGEILQEGDRNYAAIENVAWSGKAFITQQGDDNRASVFQGRFSGNFLADFTQIGDKNLISGIVDTDPASQIDGARATVLQMGDENIVLLEQEAGIADVMQEGNLNVARVEQFGPDKVDHTANVHQLGDSNTATISQSN